ncbi:MAG: calcium-binding protein [Phenylobacterium sp.]
MAVITAAHDSDTLAGTAGDDSITGSKTGDLIDGAGGNDTIDGGASNLLPTGGQDTLHGGSGADQITGNSGGVFTGDAGDDTITAVSDAASFIEGGAGDDRIVGTPGSTFALYATATAGVHVSLALAGLQDVGGGLGSDTLANIWGLVGSPFNDTLKGGDFDNTFNGNGGVDTLIGGDGEDTFYIPAGGAGSVDGGGFVDIAMPQGADLGTIAFSHVEYLTISVVNHLAASIEQWSAFRDIDATTPGSTVTANITGAGGSISFQHRWIGSQALDIDGHLATSALNVDGANTGGVITGSDFNDTLYSFLGGSTLLGGAGDDTLEGNLGGDSFTGGAGADKITASAGNDSFVYHSTSESTGAGYDTIHDFDADNDRFAVGYSITGVDAKVTSGALDAGSFDAGLAAAVGAAQLAGHHAVLFAPSGGDLAGHTFLVIDANNTPGYQTGEDYVMDITGASNLADLGVGDFVL